MPRNPQSPPDLPNAELDILAFLWNQGPSTSRQVRDGLETRRPMAHATALTFLTRLERKGMVCRKKIAGRRGYVYSLTPRSEPTFRRLLQDLADRVFGGSAVQLVSSLFKGRSPTREEVRQLRQLLNELEKKTI